MSQSKLTQQRVFIVGNGSLFDDGVTRLLAHKTNLSVSRVTYFNDLAFLDDFKSDLPDVILICESGSLEAAHIFDLVSSHSTVTGFRIVVIRLHNNVIDIYARPAFVAGELSGKPRRITARTSDELVSAFSN